MQRIVSLIVAVFLGLNLLSQILVIDVKDDMDNYVDGYSIYKNSELIKSSADFVSILNGSLYDTIVVKKYNLASLDYVIESLQDTIKITFNLLPKIQEINQIVLSYERQKKIAGEENENIIDYYFYPESNAYLIIKSSKGEYYLEKKIGAFSVNWLLNFKPKSLFLDVLGNTHIVSKDSVYQIWIDDSLNYISVIPIFVFENRIKPLIYKNSNFLFYQNYSNHNQCFELTKTDSSNRPKIISKSFDKVSFNVANSEYNEIIKLYYLETTSLNNVIINGSWNGDIKDLGETAELLNKIVWYSKIRSKPIDCQSFGMIDCLIVLNLFENKIEKFNLNGDFLGVIKLTSLDLKDKILIYDYFFDAIYIFGILNEEKLLFKINIESGTLQKVCVLENRDPHNLKVVGNFLYFLERNESGYRKLYKMAI